MASSAAHKGRHSSAILPALASPALAIKGMWPRGPGRSFLRYIPAPVMSTRVLPPRSLRSVARPLATAAPPTLAPRASPRLFRSAPLRALLSPSGGSRSRPRPRARPRSASAFLWSACAFSRPAPLVVWAVAGSPLPAPFGLRGRGLRPRGLTRPCGPLFYGLWPRGLFLCSRAPPAPLPSVSVPALSVVSPQSPSVPFPPRGKGKRRACGSLARGRGLQSLLPAVGKCCFPIGRCLPIVLAPLRLRRGNQGARCLRILLDFRPLVCYHVLAEPVPAVLTGSHTRGAATEEHLLLCLSSSSLTSPRTGDKEKQRHSAF